MSRARELTRKVFTRKYSLTLSVEALEWLLELVRYFEIPDDEVESTMGTIAGHIVAEEDVQGLVPLSLVEATYQKIRAATSDSKDDGNGGGATMAGDNDEAGANAWDVASYLRFVNARDMPRSFWNEQTKMLETTREKPTALAGPSAKSAYLRDRFNIIKQAVLRNDHFSPPVFSGREAPSYMKLTNIKNMLGRQGSSFLLFGLLTRGPDGAFYLEDLDDKVELDFSEASPQTGLFTEGSLVLVDGEYTIDTTFKVSELGMPPPESRQIARSRFGHIDLLGTGALTKQEEAELAIAERSRATSFIIFSDVHLDSLRTLSSLASVFDGYTAGDEDSVPSLFIFCGNFRSRPYVGNADDLREYTEIFAALGALIKSYPMLGKSHFLLVPGPTDPWSSTLLPRDPLPDILTKSLRQQVPNVKMASNPCRIQWFSQEIVIARDDFMSKVMRNALRITGGADTDVRKALVQTIMDQAHLYPLPLSVQPIMWELDHALRLYPMPSTVILADKFESYKLVYEKCLVFNPGPSAVSRRTFSWGTYYPNMADATERFEQSELPDV